MNDIFLGIIKKDFSDIEELKTFNDGWDHTVIVVNNKYAYRFPKNRSYQHKLRVETDFIKYFSKISQIQVPLMQLHEFNDLLYVTYQFVNGTSFTYDKINFMTSLQVKVNGKKLGEFLKTLHTVPLQKAAELELKTMDLNTFWPKKMLQTLDAFRQHLSSATISQISNLYDEFIKKLSENDITLCVNHSDLKQPHIIINEDNIQGIIDFSEIVIGDPAYDFQYLARYGTDFFDAILSSYMKIDSYFLYRQKFYDHLSYLEEFEASLLTSDERLIAKSKQILEEKFRQ